MSLQTRKGWRENREPTEEELIQEVEQEFGEYGTNVIDLMGGPGFFDRLVHSN